MLKIVKKNDIAPQKVESSYTPQHQTQEKVAAVVRATEGWRVEAVAQHLGKLPSISASLLAEIIQKVVAGLQESNVEESLALILQAAALHHDQRQLRHHLKHKSRVDSHLLLLLLWGKREDPLAIYLVNVVVDSYTVQLMLNSKDIVNAWKDYLSARINNLQSKEEVLALLTQQQIEVVSTSAFRKLIIPL